MIDLTQWPELNVRQELEHLEAFTGFETKNQYSVMAPDGKKLLHAAEESGFLARMFLKSHRPLTIHVVDAQGQPVLGASRSFFWFFSHLHVRDGAGRPLGTLRRRFGVLQRKFTLEDSNGQPVAEIKGPLIRPNTFMVHKQGTEVARVTKRWSGLLKEAFTDTDTFQVRLDNRALNQESSLLVLATAFAIDLDFFES